MRRWRRWRVPLADLFVVGSVVATAAALVAWTALSVRSIAALAQREPASSSFLQGAQRLEAVSIGLVVAALSVAAAAWWWVLRDCIARPMPRRRKMRWLFTICGLLGGHIWYYFIEVRPNLGRPRRSAEERLREFLTDPNRQREAGSDKSGGEGR